MRRKKRAIAVEQPLANRPRLRHDRDTATDSVIEIREVETRDHQYCTLIFSNAWNSALPDIPRQISVEEFRSETNDELTIGAVRGSQILGFISLWEPAWFIHHLYVDPILHGQGIGTTLVAHAE